MIDREKKRREDELLVVHPPRQPVADTGDDAVAGRSAGGPTRDTVRRQLLAAADPAERATILRSIQERFGNDVAEALIAEARTTRGPGGESARGPEPPPEKKDENV